MFHTIQDQAHCDSKGVVTVEHGESKGVVTVESGARIPVEIDECQDKHSNCNDKVVHGDGDDYENLGCFSLSTVCADFFRNPHRKDDLVSKEARSATSKLQTFSTAWDSLTLDDQSTADHGAIESELATIHASLDKLTTLVESRKAL